MFQQSKNNYDDVRPSGLYVDHEGISEGDGVCVLPYLNEEQTKQVIASILHHFPDYGKPCTAATRLSFRPNLTKLE